MKKLAKKEIAIGVSVIIAILILVFGIEFLKGINLFRPANFYIAYYDNVDGLEVSAPVKVNGYKVGQVREINFDYDKPGKSEVVLALNKNLRLPVDSKAIITSTLMGEAYIEIEVGTSNQYIPVGGEVETQKGSGLLDGISDSLMPKVTQTLGVVDTLLINLNKVVGDTALTKAIGKLDGVSENILLASYGLNNVMNKDVPLLLNNANGVVTSTNGMIGELRGITGNLGGVMTRIDTVSSNLVTFTGELNRLPLAGSIAELNKTLVNLEEFSSQLKSRNSTLGLLMNDPELYNRLNSVAASVDSLIVDIKRNPKRYISIKLL